MFERGFKTHCETIAVQVRRAVQLSSTDPLSASDLAQHLGVLLWTPTDLQELSPDCLTALLGHQSKGWSALTISNGTHDAIIYNPGSSKVRQASDQMHEMSHLLLGHEPAKMIIAAADTPPIRSHDQKQESEAAWLSGCLLLPRPALVHIRKIRMQEDDALKVYSVSQTMLRYRMGVTGVDRQLRRVGK